MNDLQIFQNPEFGEIRTIYLDGEAWLVGKDIASALGYQNQRDALIKHVHAEDKRDDVAIRDAIGRQQNTICINESGVYSLIFSSKLETATKFKRWVTKEVLPSIRQTGAYITGQETASEDELIERALLAVHKRLEMREKQIAEQKEVITEQATVIETQTKQIEEMKPTVEYADKVLNSKNLLSATQVGKCFGMSAQKLNALLHEWGIHYKQNEQWVLYSPYDSKGYTKSVTRSYPYGDGSQGSRQETQWTEKGKQFVYEQMLKHGIISKEGTLI